MGTVRPQHDAKVRRLKKERSMPELWGLSTGPITAKGRARALANLVQFRQLTRTLNKSARARNGVRLLSSIESTVITQIRSDCDCQIVNGRRRLKAIIGECPFLATLPISLSEVISSTARNFR